MRQRRVPGIRASLSPAEAKLLKQPFKSIDEAIAQLGQPETIWLRGHTEMHRLVPWLLRLRGGLDVEAQIANRFLCRDTRLRKSFHDLESIIEMHNSYVPTRLINWTDSLYVAVFCALAREFEAPTIFVLNPLELNRLSGLGEIPSINSLNRVSTYLSGWPTKLMLPDAPVAVRSSLGHLSSSRAFYTLHGSDPRPLEEQCFDCVKKVVLTDKERSMATEYVLAGG